MATYDNFSKCYDFFNELTNKAAELINDVSENITVIRDIFTKQNIASIISIAKNPDILQNIDKINELKAIIDLIIKATNINKLEFDMYNINVNSNDTENPLHKLINNTKYNDPKYIYYYTLPEHNDKPLPYSKITILSMKINRLHFYLNDTLVKLYQQFCVYGAMLDCFINVTNVPHFFTEYIAKLGINGLHILDIEIILGLITRLLLLDLTKEAFPEYNKSGEIIKVNNVFDILFKWSHLNKSDVLKNKIFSGIAKLADKKVNITKQIDSVIEILFGILTDETGTKYKTKCHELYKNGLMSISVYLAYVIKSFKTYTPVLSFSHLGYIDDLADIIIKNADAGLKQIQNGGQKGGIIGINDIYAAAGVIGTLETLGLFKVIGMIFNSLKPGIYSCVRSYYSEKQLDMTKNISFNGLSSSLHTSGDNIIINIINGQNQQNLEYLAMFIKTFSINDTITMIDKLLLMPNVCGDKVGGGNNKVKENPFKPLSMSYSITHKLIKALNFVDTGILIFDMLYLVLSEQSSLFKIYNTLITRFAKCEIYKFTDEIEHANNILLSFINNISPKTQVIIRQRILAYIIIQNVYLLGEKYKQDAANQAEFYTMANSIDSNKIKLFDHNIIQLCELISKIICVSPAKYSKHLDDINEFILACLGRPNELFNSELTETLSKLVDYNFKIYRGYVMHAKQAVINKALIFKQIQTKQKQQSNNSEEFFDAINTTVEHTEVSDKSQTYALPMQNVDVPTGNINIDETSFVSEYNTSFFAVNLVSDIGKAAKKKIVNMADKATKYMANVTNAAMKMTSSLLATPNPDLATIVELNNSISSIPDAKTKLETVTNTIESQCNSVKQEVMNIEVNDNYITNKQKVHIFVSKLAEYVLYVSLPQLESRLQYNINDNTMICDETSVILSHLLDEKTAILLETEKQKSKIRFITY